MPAKSKKQKRFMGAVKSCHDKPCACKGKKVKEVAKSMKKKDVEDFAKSKVKESFDVDKTVVSFINDMINKNYSSARSKMSEVVESRLKAKVKALALKNS